MGSETNKDDRNTTEYLAQLINDKKQMVAFPNIFVHVDKLLDEGKSSDYKNIRINAKLTFYLI